MADNSEEYISPERLDELLEVTDRKGWIALLGLVLLVFFAILWLFLGKIPTRVKGTGMLINVGGIYSITAGSNGRIDKFNIKIGDFLTANQPVAYISQIDLINEINNLKEKIQEQKTTNTEREEIRTDLAVKYAEQLTALNRKLDSELKLLKNGLTIEREALNTKEKLTEVSKNLEELKMSRLADQHQLNGLVRELKSLQVKYDQSTIVRSPVNGVVIELKESVGNIVKPGSQLLSLETVTSATHHLVGIVYISALEGKRIQPGMSVRVIPSIIKPEEYGSIVGKINYVSAYPATLLGMIRVLQNEEMVKNILSKGDQIEVHIDLMLNNETYSGYEWTSKEGPPVKIQSGTLCEGRITVRETRPIELIIPKIKEWIGQET